MSNVTTARRGSSSHLTRARRLGEQRPETGPQAASDRELGAEIYERLGGERAMRRRKLRADQAALAALSTEVPVSPDHAASIAAHRELLERGIAMLRSQLLSMRSMRVQLQRFASPTARPCTASRTPRRVSRARSRRSHRVVRAVAKAASGDSGDGDPEPSRRSPSAVGGAL